MTTLEKTSRPLFGGIQATVEEHLDSKPNQEKSSFPGSERSIREFGVVKYYMRLSQKARTLKLCTLPNSPGVLEIAVKREEERCIQLPWLLSFTMLWEKERNWLSSCSMGKFNFPFFLIYH